MAERIEKKLDDVSYLLRWMAEWDFEVDTLHVERIGTNFLRM